VFGANVVCSTSAAAPSAALSLAVSEIATRSVWVLPASGRDCRDFPSAAHAYNADPVKKA